MVLTDEEKRAAARKRSKEYRDRKAAEKRAQETAARDERDAEAPAVMVSAVEAALAAMSKWLVDSDAASVAQARMLARRVDRYEHSDDDVKLLSAHRALTRVLNDLGGTPTVRMQHELRSLKLAAKTEVLDGGEGETEKPAGNVSKFERPPKRKRG